MSHRSMIKYLLADNFYGQQDIETYLKVANLYFSDKFIDKEYGKEVPDLNIIIDNLEYVFSRALGERVIIDHKSSGVFRKPHNGMIHFESFDSLNEWCFIVALEPNTINFYYHLKDYLNEEYRTWDSKNALQGFKFNYRNTFEWDYHTNILLEPNDGIFFRPWTFHSLNDGLVQYFRLITDSKFRILVMGDPTSSRTKVAKMISERLRESIYINSFDLRKDQKDIDFSVDGKLRHAYRTVTHIRNSNYHINVLDMVCSLPDMRRIINPDILVWVNDQKSITLEDWVDPKRYDFKINNMKHLDINELVHQIVNKRNYNDGNLDY